MCIAEQSSQSDKKNVLFCIITTVPGYPLFATGDNSKENFINKIIQFRLKV